MCFPHVDEDTKNILQSFVDEAKDYNDFADRLCERVLREPSSSLLTYFAFFHAFRQEKYKLLKKLIEARIGSALTKSIELTYYARRGDHIEWAQFQKSITAALRMTENDWMACHIYITWREFIEFFYFPDTDMDYSPLDILESKIMTDENFEFFLTSLYHIKATRLAREGNIEEARICFDQAILVATKHDDSEQLATLLFEKANMVKHMNFDEALSILKVQKDICERIGYIHALGLNTHCLGHIAAAKGELDAAIEYQSEYIAIRKSLGLPIGFMKCVLAHLYNLKGNGKTALQLTIEGKKDMASSAISLAQTQEVWALMNLNRFDKATNILDELRESSLKTAEEAGVGQIHFLEGLMEKRRHEYSSALLSFEEALGIFERLRGLIWINPTLVQLTDVEINAYPCSEKSVKTKLSGPWMQKLMKQVEERELPGFAMQALLLQAKFAFRQGRIVQSKKMIKRVLKAAETSSMMYLREMAESLVPELVASS